MEECRWKRRGTEKSARAVVAVATVRTGNTGSHTRVVIWVDLRYEGRVRPCLDNVSAQKMNCVAGRTRTRERTLFRERWVWEPILPVCFEGSRLTERQMLSWSRRWGWGPAAGREFWDLAGT